MIEKNYSDNEKAETPTVRIKKMRQKYIKHFLYSF